MPDEMNVPGSDRQGPDQEQAPAHDTDDSGADETSDETRSALTDVTERLHDVAEQLAEFHRRSEHREQVIDRLHEENLQLRAGLSKAILEPVVSDLIRLYDQADREVRRLAAAGQDHRLLESFAIDVEEILDRCGIEIYRAKPGDPFDRDRHRPLGVVDCPEESRHNTVAEMTAVGFVERETGRVRRPLQARFFQYTQAREPVPDGAAAQSQ